MAAGLWVGGTLQAASPTYSWNNASGGEYGVGANWTASNGGVQGNVPGQPGPTADVALIGVAGTLTPGSVLYDQSSYNYGVGGLTVGSAANSTVSFTLSGGTLGITNTAASVFLLGNANPSTATFTMNGGTLNCLRNASTFYQDFFILGNAANASGTFTLNSGTANFLCGIELGNFAGATGTVNINGGTFIDNGWFGIGRGGSGTGSGVLNMSGGTAYFLRNPGSEGNTSGLSFCQGGSSGTVNISGGVLYVNRIGFAAPTGSTHNDTETLNVSGGDIYLGAGGIVYGNGGGTKTVSIYLSGGTFHTANMGANTGGTQGTNSITFTGPQAGADWLWGSESHLAATLNTSPGPGTITFAPEANRTITLSNSFSGLGGLTMSGPGTLAINGANFYSGATTLNGGTTAGFGSVSGAVTANAGATIASGTTLAPGTLTLGGTSLTLNGDTNVIKLSADPTTAGSGVNDLLASSGSLVLQNVSTIKVVPLAPLNTASSYMVLQYNGTPLLASDAAHLHVTSDSARYSFSVVDPSTTFPYVEISVTGNAASLIWRGTNSSNRGAWDHTTLNWLNTGTSAFDVFYSGDATIFDDSGTNSVTVTGAEQPVVMAFSNNAVAYTFTGVGSLTGPLDLEGTGSLTLALSSTPTLLGITNNSELLLFNFANGIANTISAPISDNGLGGGTIIQAGTNTVSLSGDNSFYNGKLMVTNGILQYASANSLGAIGVPLVVTNNGTLDFHHVNAGSKPVIVSGAGYNGTGALTDSGTGLGVNTVVSSITLAGDTTFSSVGRWEQPASVNTFAGNGYNLTVIGSGVILLNDDGDTGLGNVMVLGTRFGFENTIGLGDPTKTITVDAGVTNALLTFFSVASPMDKNLVLKNNAVLDSGGTANTFVGPVTLFATNTIGLRTDLHLSGPIGGAGSMIVATNTSVGNGAAGVTLHLEGTNTYTGATVLNPGSTVVLGANAVLGPSSLVALSAGSKLDASALGSTDLSFGAGQTLSGIGTVVGPSSGNVNFNSGSTLEVGLTPSSLATLSVQAYLHLHPGCTNIMKVNAGAVTGDNISGLTDVTYAGTLVISNLGGSFAAGNTFQLFNSTAYDVASAFDQIIPPTPGAGLAWDPSNLRTNGTLRVIAVTAPGFTATTRLNDGNIQFTFTGQVGDHYTLHASTNVAKQLALWDILSSGTIATSPMNIKDLTATNYPQRFYRISDP